MDVLDAWGERRERYEMARDLEQWQMDELEKLRVGAAALRAVEAWAQLDLGERVFRLRYPAGGDPSDSMAAQAAGSPVPWEEIGEALGTTGEAARQRFGKVVKDRYVSAVREWAEGFGPTDEQMKDIVSVAQEEEV